MPHDTKSKTGTVLFIKTKIRTVPVLFAKRRCGCIIRNTFFLFNLSLWCLDRTMKIAQSFVRNFLLGLAIFLICEVCHAGPPFFTDDPVPVEYKHTEIYFASSYVSEKGGISGSAPFFDMNYGILPDVHAHVTTPFNFNHAKGEPDGEEPGDDPHTNYGYGDTELGFKWRLIHETWYIPQIAVYPAVEILTGNFQRGLGAGRAMEFLPVWLQKGWGKWTAYGGGGYWINPGDGNKNWTYLGGVLQRDLSEWFLIGSEINFRSRDTVDSQNGVGPIWEGNSTSQSIILFCFLPARMCMAPTA